MIRSLILLATAVALPANAAQNRPGTPLAECKLPTYKAALTAAEGVFHQDAVENEGALVGKEFVTDYATDTFLPLGMRPDAFARHDVTTSKEESHDFRSTLMMPYDDARTALIARMGRACDVDSTGLVKACYYELPDDTAGNYTVSVSARKVNATKTYLNCRYSRKL
ncbi:MAG: hypothetical protein EOP62_06230 [Sphingomonadales bacterium]|nr:MAG: hypothetical protein EOP62_06230 [Sphingomonadales bacterium]